MSNANEPRRLVVGIDYGTTFSGIALALHGTSYSDIQIHHGYPTALSYHVVDPKRVPTTVAYDVKLGELLLDESPTRSDFDDPNLNRFNLVGMMRVPADKFPRDVAKEFFARLHGEYTRAATSFLKTNNLDRIPVNFWISVPASWNDRARDLIVNIAKSAGFATRPTERIHIISEPEAAAYADLNTLTVHLARNMRIMICDCGGGTVDVGIYKVLAINPNLQLEPLYSEMSGKCGGTYVDRNLFQLLSQRFGQSFTNLGNGMTGPGSEFMAMFEQCKRQFSSSLPAGHIFELKLEMEYGGRTLDPRSYDRSRSRILLTTQDFKEMFDPAVDMIIRLLDAQVAQIDGPREPPIDGFVLVGGFGTSLYLKERLRDWCESGRVPSCALDDSSAVVRGAVSRGLNTQVVGYVCRKHYGISVPWFQSTRRARRRLGTRRLPSQNEFGVRQLGKRVRWMVKKGEVLMPYVVAPDKKFTIYSDGRESHMECLCSFASPEPPNLPMDQGVEVVGRITYSIANLDLTRLRYRTTSEGRLYKAELKAQVFFDPSTWRLAFRVLGDGLELGRAWIGLPRE
ncbi:Chaperone DnaK-like protein [Cladobotryum mycophilum]|uniref:Chaperone DnaK-like protein n=1 Tax=Cladobotryum mycophilum TaxID=491253 RepID=A0ABR0SSE7_9HYPO